MSGKILVVDDVATNRIVMKVKLSSACYEVLQASGGREALQLARRELPDLILLDVMMPDLDGFSVCATLKSDAATAHIPIIMVTALSDTEARLKGLQAGADDFLNKPLDEVTLLARVRNLFRRGSSAMDRRMRDQTRFALGRKGLAADDAAALAPGQIAMICASPKSALRWTQALNARLPDDVVSVSRESALEGGKSQPDLFVLECSETAPTEALHLMAELRARPATRTAGFVMLLPERHQKLTALALDQGAHDVLILPAHTDEMALRLRSQIGRKRQADQMRNDVADGLQLAVIDPLTGLFNRRYALNHLENISIRAQSTGRDFAVLMLDLDHFKQVNDRYGHTAGDQVLVALTNRLRINLRAMDLIARIGGEEFLITLPESTAAQAQDIANRLRRVIQDNPVLLEDGTEVNMTVSLGLSMGEPKTGTTDIARLLDRADRALYAAKAQGRNQVATGGSLTAA